MLLTAPPAPGALGVVEKAEVEGVIRAWAWDTWNMSARAWMEVLNVPMWVILNRVLR